MSRDPSTTYRLTELQAAAVEAVRRRAARRIALVVYHEGGVETAVLEPGAPLVVGRRAPADLAIADPSLSRTHARFTLTAPDRVLVEDLGSTNGLRAAGQRVTSTEIGPGGEVVLGHVLASVRVLDAAEAPAQPVSRVSTAADRAPIAAAPAMRATFELAERVAASSVPVVLHGETGSGKEVVARFVHERSSRRAGPLVCVNCAAIPSQLVESTLFGHEKGAFTGAGQRQKGVFEEADGGTVFLDEIGELPPAAQAALLRVLETRRFARVGSVKEVASDVRVIAATHRDLEAMSQSGAFRADLYYRLSTVVLTIPPLRERVEDIEPLARTFLKEMACGRPLDLTPEALATLRAYAWPGNVRELRNAVERAVVIAQGDALGPADLPPALRRAPSIAPPTFGAPPVPSFGAPPVPSFGAPPVPSFGAPAASFAPRPSSVAPPPGSPDLRSGVQAYEAQIIAETLQQTGWNQSETARRLGIPIRTMAHKIKALGLKKPQ